MLGFHSLHHQITSKSQISQLLHTEKSPNLKKRGKFPLKKKKKPRKPPKEEKFKPYARFIEEQRKRLIFTEPTPQKKAGITQNLNGITSPEAKSQLLKQEIGTHLQPNEPLSSQLKQIYSKKPRTTSQRHRRYFNSRLRQSQMRTQTP